MKPMLWRANPDEEDHRLESRVRENRMHGSEGGEDLVLPDPYQRPLAAIGTRVQYSNVG